MSQSVLVINSGSSSIKYRLIEPESGVTIANGLVERIGEETSFLAHHYGEITVREDTAIANHEAGLRRVVQLFGEVGPDLADAGVVAVGHRVVQGGAHFDRAVLVDDAVKDTIRELIPLGPLHNPAALEGIEVAQRVFPTLPQVTVFDTAFFQSLPDASATYALDKDVAEKYSIRRYGAHGTSHQYVSNRVASILKRDDLKQVVLHIGNGASASAVVNGHAVDTSMGLTPLEGLVMGTRTGDIDPAAVFHLARVAGMSVDEIDTLFNKQSGMKGLTGENDMREVWALAESGNADARLGLDVYVHRLKKYVGAYAAVMNGIDTLTFTAGIGENDHGVRQEVCEGLSFLGIKLDLDANAVRSGEERIISAPDSALTVLVVPTNEELEIARQTAAAIA